MPLTARLKNIKTSDLSNDAMNNNVHQGAVEWKAIKVLRTRKVLYLNRKRIKNQMLKIRLILHVLKVQYLIEKLFSSYLIESTNKL